MSALRVVATVGIVACATPTAAQLYVPSGELGPGTELVAVLISSSTCAGNADKSFIASVPRMMWSVGEEARSNGMNPVLIGVALDDDTKAGISYLNAFGTFDELSVGRTWGNAVVIDHVWADPDGQPMIPQVVLLARDVRGAGDRIIFENERVLGRWIGPKAIARWTRAGTPIPAEALTP